MAQPKDEEFVEKKEQPEEAQNAELNQEQEEEEYKSNLDQETRTKLAHYFSGDHEGEFYGTYANARYYIAEVYNHGGTIQDLIDLQDEDQNYPNDPDQVISVISGNIVRPVEEIKEEIGSKQQEFTKDEIEERTELSLKARKFLLSRQYIEYATMRLFSELLKNNGVSPEEQEMMKNAASNSYAALAPVINTAEFARMSVQEQRDILKTNSSKLHQNLVIRNNAEKRVEYFQYPSTIEQFNAMDKNGREAVSSADVIYLELYDRLANLFDGNPAKIDQINQNMSDEDLIDNLDLIYEARHFLDISYPDYGNIVAAVKRFYGEEGAKKYWQMRDKIRTNTAGLFERAQMIASSVYPVIDPANLPKLHKDTLANSGNALRRDLGICATSLENQKTEIRDAHIFQYTQENAYKLGLDDKKPGVTVYAVTVENGRRNAEEMINSAVLSGTMTRGATEFYVLDKSNPEKPTFKVYLPDEKMRLQAVEKPTAEMNAYMTEMVYGKGISAVSDWKQRTDKNFARIAFFAALEQKFGGNPAAYNENNFRVAQTVATAKWFLGGRLIDPDTMKPYPADEATVNAVAQAALTGKKLPLVVKDDGTLAPFRLNLTPENVAALKQKLTQYKASKGYANMDQIGALFAESYPDNAIQAPKADSKFFTEQTDHLLAELDKTNGFMHGGHQQYQELQTAEKLYKAVRSYCENPDNTDTVKVRKDFWNILKQYLPDNGPVTGRNEEDYYTYTVLGRDQQYRALMQDGKDGDIEYCRKVMMSVAANYLAERAGAYADYVKALPGANEVGKNERQIQRAALANGLRSLCRTMTAKGIYLAVPVKKAQEQQKQKVKVKK